jgi:8-amino-7-oxononanoate synthase
MKFTINKNVIENIIFSMQPFLEKKDASSITSHIYIEITSNSLILRATDYEMGLEAIINDIKDIEEGKSTVNGSNLINIVRRLKDNDIIFETIDNNLNIKQGRSSFKLPMYDANEYPSFPNMQNLQNLDINIINLINSIKKITPSIDNAILVGSGFLANIALIESMVRKGDVLFIDEHYHASGILATKLVQGEVIVFEHNNYLDLEDKIKTTKIKGRILIAIEGVYSMSGDIAPKEFVKIVNKHNGILIVDEAHSSGVIGDNLLGWFDYWNIKPKSNHIKMGTLGKAYGSYGAYILASNQIISYLENRAKPIIYSTAPSLFDIALANEGLKYIIKHKKKLKNKIKQYQKIVHQTLGLKPKSLIVPIIIDDNKKVLDIQKELLTQGFVVGAIRQPTVKKAIIRLILKLDVKKKVINKVLKNLMGTRG